MVNTNGTPFVSSTFSRVTSNLSRSVILANLRRAQEEILLSQEQISTGIRITRPSVDPIGANRIMDFQTRINQSNQFLANINTGSRRLEVSDNSMSGVNELIDRAREILLDQVQSTATTATRRMLAEEVSELLRQAVNLGNTRFENRALFGGSQTDISPHQFAGTAVAYAGDNRRLMTNVADGLSIQANVLADEAFGVYSTEIRGVDLTTLAAIDLNPAVISGTSITALRAGQGVSMGSISVTGAASTVIDLSIADNVGDVIALINARSTTTGITASINPANNGLRLTRSGGGTIVVTEVANGTTASQLGIFTGTAGVASPLTGSDLNPALTSYTTVGSLFAGAGLTTASGITITNISPDATYTATIGSTVFSAGNTIEDVLNAINNSGTYVDARISTGHSAIDVFSRLSGGRLTISEASASGTTATQIGLLSTLRRARLDDLNGGLGVDSVQGDDIRITRRDGVQITLDVDDATTVKDLLDAISADPFLDAALTAGNQIAITDTTGGTGPLRVENINQSFAATTLGIEGFISGVTLTGTALTFSGVQVEGVFTALIRVRDALLADSPEQMRVAHRLLDQVQEQLTTARAAAGSRMVGLELTQNRLQSEKLELQAALSDVQDVDLAEAASRLQLQQTVLEAGLAVAARILQTSILNYL